MRAPFNKWEGTTDSMDLNAVTRDVIALSLSDLQRNRVIIADLVNMAARLRPARAPKRQHSAIEKSNASLGRH